MGEELEGEELEGEEWAGEEWDDVGWWEWAEDPLPWRPRRR